MRFVIAFLALCGLALMAGDVVPAVAAADNAYNLALTQQPSGQIDVNIDVDNGEWWANPVWIGVGILALILLIVIVAMATRGGGGTTVVKD